MRQINQALYGFSLNPDLNKSLKKTHFSDWWQLQHTDYYIILKLLLKLYTVIVAL